MLQNSDGVSAGAGVYGVSTNVNYQVAKAKMSSNSDMSMVKSTLQWNVGDDRDHRPTKIGIINLNDLLRDQYWRHCEDLSLPAWKAECCTRRDAYRENIVKALNEYPEFKHVKPIGGREKLREVHYIKPIELPMIPTELPNLQNLQQKHLLNLEYNVESTCEDLSLPLNPNSMGIN